MPSPSSRFDLTHAASPWSEFRRTKSYDLLAGLPLIVWFGYSVYHQLGPIASEFENAQASGFDAVEVISLLGKVAGVAFVAMVFVLTIIRCAPKARAAGLLPRVSALLGMNLGLAIALLPPQSIGFELSVLSLLLLLCGLGFSVYAMLHLGRSFSVMAEARRLVMDGPYARIRHPLYLGEQVAMLGMTLQFLSAYALLILGLQFAFQIIRMRNEERVLSGIFPEYSDYKTRTARLIPGLY
jgi:protein-S-isoprenylcysteine O-methyltransferase Ste14